MAESAHLADPHVMVGLVAADGGPVDLAAAHQPATGQGVRPHRRPHPAERAPQIGLVNHVCPDGRGARPAWPAPAHRQAARSRPSEDTKRILNLHLERAVLATLDFALTAEDRSFTSPELRANSTACAQGRQSGLRDSTTTSRTLQRVVRDVVERECPPRSSGAVVDAGATTARALWKTSCSSTGPA
jgi:enoyl-CoA hydratase/carnithine racemase